MLAAEKISSELDCPTQVLKLITDILKSQQVKEVNIMFLLYNFLCSDVQNVMLSERRHMSYAC